MAKYSPIPASSHEKENKIEDLIFAIRGKQVMLDSDLARLYLIKTKRLNEGVKR